MNARLVAVALVAGCVGFMIAELGGERPGPAAAQAADRPSIAIDDSKASAMYANFCRITGTPEEVVLDFGLNPQPFGVPKDPVPISQRIVLNYYSAKRMLSALQITVERHESLFGRLETDVQKRVREAPGKGKPADPQRPEKSDQL